MKKIIEVRVPDIGDSKAVPVVEVLAAVGDRLSRDDIILVLESDKATLEVPIGAEGRVLELLVAVGDEVSEGSLIAKVGSISAHPESIEPSVSDVTTPAIAALTEEVMTSLFDICVPDIGDSQQVPVVEIPINVGDILSADDVVAILESDKAAMEVPAETEGRVVEILIKVGDEVGEGCSIARVEPTAAQVDIPVASVAQPPAPAAHSEVYVRHQTQLPSQSQPVYASPSIRRFARSLGVPIEQVEGTGSKGRLVREDIEAYVKHQLTYSAPVAAPVGDSVLAGLPDWPKIDFEKFGPIERKELSRIARISGPALSRNALIIPHVCNFDKADITSLEAFRKALNTEASSDDAKISLLTFAVKAVVSALKAYPLFNSSLEGDEVVIKQYWHIGIAVDTPNGLMVPVIRDVDRKSIRDVANEMQQLAVKARSGKLSQTEMSGATFTISSLGGVGGTGFVPIINAPEVAILGMTRAEVQPYWNDSEFLPRLIQPMSLSWDHRVIDGVAAAHFLQHVSRALTDFRRVVV